MTDRGDAAGRRSPAAWRRTRELLNAAVERDAADRRAFLERVCGDDAALLGDVLSLLDAHERIGPVDRLASALHDAAASAAAPAEPASPDDRIGHYRILERVGGGGMGVVYRAHDERLDRAVALKFLSPALLADPDWRDRFLAEARAAAALEHPNICTIHEIGEADDGRLFIAMPLYAGRTVRALLRDGALPVDRALAFAFQSCDGLARAHDHGIVHRDVKPANLMVTDDAVVKILDFGVATADQVSDAGPHGPAGTAAYMSPEQALGEPVDQRTDVWSLGVVLYEMLTGARPFEGERRAELHAAILAADPRPAARLRPELPDAVDGVLRRALARDPADRYGSMGEMARALAAVRGGAAGAAPGVGGPERVGEAGRGPEAARASVAGAVGVESATPADAAAVPPGGELRQATVLVATVTGFAEAADRAYAGEIARLRERLRRAAERVVARHGGRVERRAHGLLMAVFGVPSAREDDCLRAVRAARALHERVGVVTGAVDGAAADGLASRVRVRSGVHTGRIVAMPTSRGAEGARVSGEALRAARRLAGAAAPGTVLIGPGARRLVAPFFRTAPATPLALVPDAAPVTPWRVGEPSGFETRLEAAARGGLTPYAGRVRELELLAARLARAREGEGQFVSVLAEAGAGKSRLLHEFESRIDAGAVRVLRGRCRSYGGQTAYLPFREVLGRLLGIPEGESPAARAERAVAALQRIAPELDGVVPLCLHLLSLPSEAHPLPGHLRGDHFRAALQDALGAVLTLSARRRPVVLLLEDWHEADAASDQVLRRLLELAPAYPLLVVVTHRPGHGVDWGDSPAHTPVRLGPLDASAADEIVRWVFDADDVSPALGRALRERADGNPFFLEELCRALREDGAVTVERGRARAEAALDGMGLPETVQGVIRTRLDRLDGEAREAVRVASVIGREFDVRVLGRVLADRSGPDACLDRLKALGLVHPVRVLPARAYRFQHALTRDVAYESIPHARRRRLHGRVGRAIEAVRGDRPDEFLDELAHHFGTAREWRKAADYAVAAAERAVALSEFEQALGLLERAQRWLGEPPAATDLAERVTDVLLRQERVCETLGLRIRQQRIIDALFDRLDARADRARLADVHRRQGDLHTLGRRFDEAARSLAHALRLSRELDDARRERNTRRSIGLLRWHQGRDAVAARQVERALAIDRERGDAEAIAGDLANLGNVLRSRGEHERALRCLHEALACAERAGNPVKQAYILHNIGNVHRSLGDDDEALRHFETACARTAEHRLAVPYSFHLTAIAHIRLQRGEIDESLRMYREAVGIARRAKHADGLSQALRILGDVLFGLGRHEDALPHLEEAAVLLTRLGDRDGEARMRSRIAAIREAAGEDAAALDAWVRARRSHRNVGDAAGELEAAEGEARVLRRTGRADRALEAYRDAAALARALDRPAREGALRNTLGILEWERGGYETALREYERALERLEAAGDRVGTGLVSNSIGVTLSSMGRHADAVDRLEEAVARNRANGRRQWEAHGLAALADAHEALGDAAEARACLERSLAIRREIGDRVGEGWMLHDLARLASAAGDGERANGLAARATEIAESCDDARLLAACRRLRRD